MPPSRTTGSKTLPHTRFVSPDAFSPLKRNGIVNCNACWRPKSKFTLKRCGNCLVALYCSEQCQREHWDTHRVQCQLTESQRKYCEKDENLCHVNKDLFKWTAKHHPTIAKSVIDALNLHNRQGAEDDELIVIFLSYQSQATKIERKFRVLSAGPTTFKTILQLRANPLLEELPRQRRMMEKDHLKKGRNVGIAFCFLVCVGEGTASSLHRIVPITFQKNITPSENEIAEQRRNTNWLQFLVDVTENGIVF